MIPGTLTQSLGTNGSNSDITGEEWITETAAQVVTVRSNPTSETVQLFCSNSRLNYYIQTQNSHTKLSMTKYADQICLLGYLMILCGL